MTNEEIIEQEYDEELSDELAGNDSQELWEHYRFVAEKGQTLLRVDKFLVCHIETTSRQ